MTDEVGRRKPPAAKASPAKKTTAAKKTPAAKKAPAKKVAPRKAPAKHAPTTGPAVEEPVARVDGWDWVAWDDDPSADEPFDDEPSSSTGPGADQRVQQGVEGLQRAAHEFINASRALLDVVEELVDDPRAPGGVVDIFGELGTVASRLARNAARGMAQAGRGPVPDDDPDDDPPVQRIPVS